VRVIPSATVGPGDNVPLVATGTEYLVKLGEFDVLNLEGADLTPYGAADFTGTRVEADGPLAIFSGVQCTLIPDDSGGACDHLEEQTFPRSPLGHDYAVTRLRVAGVIDDLVRV